MDRFSETPEISNLMKIHPLGAKLFHADRQTGVTTLIVTICTSAKIPKSVNCFSFATYPLQKVAAFSLSAEPCTPRSQ